MCKSRIFSASINNRCAANLPPFIALFLHPSRSKTHDCVSELLILPLMRARLGSLPFLAILAVFVAAGCTGCNKGDASTDSEASSLPEEDGASGITAESPDSLVTVLPTDELSEATPAHDFSLPGVTGEFMLSDHLGEVVVLNFWATWNELSVDGMDALNEIHTELGADGIAVVGIAQDEGGLDVVMDWAREHTVAYPLVADASQTVAGQFGEIELLPTTVIIDREGLIREQHTGILTHDELLDLLGPILIEEDEPLSALPEAQEGEGLLSLPPIDVHVLVGEGAMLVDVRSLGEIEATGTALYAEHLPLQELALQDLPANFAVPIIFLGDANDDTVNQAAEQALDWGYASVYVVEGGLTAWQAAGLPVGPLTPIPTDEQPLVRARTVIG